MNVLVFAEHWDGKFKKSTYESVCYASGIARLAGGTVSAVVAGNVPDETIRMLGEYGATKVLKSSDARLGLFSSNAYAGLIAAAARETGAKVIVISNTTSGRAVAPGVAVRLKAGLVAGAVSLPQQGDKFVVRKKAFSGKAFADVAISSDIKVLTLAVNSIPVEKNPVTAEITPFSYEVPDSDMRSVSKEVIKASGVLNVTDAEIVVSGGRGMKGPEHWNLLEDLALAIGGATACSKPVADTGWRPHHEHVGQTGKAIAPNLYIAAGISGAIQHLAGINSSKVIVVINKDADAPFFKAADYGIVGDVFEVLPKLTEAVKAFKAAHH